MFQSITRTRRRHTRAAKIVAGVLIGLCVAALLYFLALRDERIRHYDVEVAVQSDGSALVRETIEYDFGANDQHGIKRTIPGYHLSDGVIEQPDEDTISEVTARSASAPDEVQLFGDELRIGDPDQTISGRHSYVITYRLPDAVADGKLAIDLIGTGWDVPIDDAKVDVRLPFSRGKVWCVRGQEFANTGCERFEGSASHLSVRAFDLEGGEGITVYAEKGTSSGKSRVLEPAGPPPAGDEYWWLWRIVLIFGIGAAGYVIGLIPVAAWARRAGRDYAYHGGGGAVDAVFGGPDLPSRPISDELADEQVTIQFVPPPDLTPAQGGVLLHEKVTDDHRVAWLTQQSIDGWFEMSNGGKTLTWTAADDRWPSAPVPLQRIFTGRKKLKLNAYDGKFATGWKLIADDLEHWRTNCGLWDAERERRSKRIQRLIGISGWIAALAGAVALYVTAPHYLLLSLVIAGVSGVLVGAGVSSAANADELKVRTAPGFAQRQLVAGFLRFFQQSESRHAREAAERGELRLYSAWAVALGELDAWDRAMSAAALPPDTPGVAESGYYAGMSSSVHTAYTAPSTSSSSSSGGSSYSSSGSVGGGAGGGGGGSW